jgi:Glycosyl hydrolases family 2, TIM barrel domain
MTGLHNHPCIVLWVLFNEGWGQYDTERLVQWMKSIDPSRLVDDASGWTDQRVGDLIDMHNYPVPLNAPPESKRAAVSGEFGGLGLRLEGHTWSAKSWGYQSVGNTAKLDAEYGRLLAMVWFGYEKRGLSAAVYTQTTDVETECNGLLTYDRAVVKPTLTRLLEANKGLARPSSRRILLTDASDGDARWRYTLNPPPPNWAQSQFDASDWSEGPAGFGTPVTPGALIGTAWNTPDIWLRRQFVLPLGNWRAASLHIYHDEDAQVYLNGTLAAALSGFEVGYFETNLSAAALAALRPGTNLIAVHCHQTTGGQFIDVGLLAPRRVPAGAVNQTEPASE